MIGVSWPRRVSLLLALVPLGLAACFGMSKELRRNGITAPGEILEVWDTGITVNDNPVVGLKVRVRPADRPAFEATIRRTEISRLAVLQFQPGQMILVRFDPRDPTQAAVDFDPSAVEAESTGNPYHDHYAASPRNGAVFLAPPASPDVYLGTADNASDTLALIENGYALLGGAGAQGAPDLQQALAQGREVRAAMVVVYGHFDPSPGTTLEVLPLRRRAAGPAEAGEPALDPAAVALVPALGPGEQFATYWARMQPSILGVYTRPLTAREQAALKRRDGVVVDGIRSDSPAAASHLLRGDVIVAIDGRPVDNDRIQVLLRSLAGRSVSIDLLRHGAPLSLNAQLNAAP